MDSRTKFYCWLIGKLEHRRMTLQEVTYIVSEHPQGKSETEHADALIKIIEIFT